ncbi:hypothetical protein GCM10023322_31450 [Rugosimonospora acidiphila]|uniref:Uncharacterized protein n=1 Tax=Rugosimonospora acidiphila TaxID=556531 RepID=A0ABP9RSM0_9ACTN
MITDVALWGTLIAIPLAEPWADRRLVACFTSDRDLSDTARALRDHPLAHADDKDDLVLQPGIVMKAMVDGRAARGDGSGWHVRGLGAGAAIGTTAAGG